ncbi:MAG: uroporphyrinogen-III synthase, partial [Gammaproteobacteria bacterium]
MQPLDGISVLVTRPADQTETLAREIESRGGIAIRAPMIVISGLTDDTTARRVAGSLGGDDVLVFFSRNAVE